MKKLCFVFGTRPEGIKIAPIAIEAAKDPNLDVKLISTDQHIEMLDQVMEVFGLDFDHRLNLMHECKNLNQLLSGAIKKLDDIYKIEKPDFIFVHGDTTTTLAASISAFYANIPIGHIEAGLRTNNIKSPFPEEANRCLTGRISDIHFCPTETSAQNIKTEFPKCNFVYTVGNSIVDAIQYVSQKLSDDKDFTLGISKKFPFLDNTKKMILVTMHRRESFGAQMQEAFEAIKHLGENYKDYQIVLPVHLNPIVQDAANSILSDTPNIFLVPPQDYKSFAYLMNKSHLILTDSGGIQEEAPSLNKPVLIMRDCSERPEVIQSGGGKLVGTNFDSIVSNTQEILNNKNLYQKMANSTNPFGDGSSSKKIVQITKEFLGIRDE